MNVHTQTGGDLPELRLTNRLNESRSPYVRGHMNNPVAWQNWNAETLALAKKYNRLIFVSIGYAACHWCHVMERESFENQEIANVLNAHFIPIKIDREERPDVDRIYMNYVQATTGSGGWPLNVFITPDLEPIFGGTYFPGPGSTTGGARGHIGFLGILEKIRDVWETQQERCLESAREITSQLREFAQEGTISAKESDPAEEDDGDIDLETLEEAYGHFARKFDKKHKGFGGAPKFPTPVNLTFLLRLGWFPDEVKHVVGEEECENAKKMVLETLEAMDKGGVHDQVGNGFARYSVTRDWSLPHFEKMLYDQGQLLPVYLDAYLVSKDPAHLATVHDIATYLTSPPLHSSTGGFCSAEDADSKYRATDTEKREGAFYVWTLKEFQQILGERDAQACARYWNVKENGNVSPEHDAHDELMDQNVLCVSTTPEKLAKEFGLGTEDVNNIIKSARQKLRDHRESERPRPSLDDKIVVAWNGLAIGALARTAAVLTEEGDREAADRYMSSAVKAAEFIQKELWDKETGKMKRVYREGPGDAPAFADDYAFLISGLIDLYEASFDERWLEWADSLQKTQLSLFWDTSRTSPGGFFSTAANQSDLILRLKDGMDNAEPSTNGVSANNLFRLSSLFDDENYAKLARRTCASFENEITQHPFLFTSMLPAVVASRLGTRGVAVCGEDGVPGVQKAISKFRGGGKVNETIVRLKPGLKTEWLRQRNELIRGLDEKRSMVQICEGGACKLEEDMGA